MMIDEHEMILGLVVKAESYTPKMESSGDHHRDAKERATCRYGRYRFDSRYHDHSSERKALAIIILGTAVSASTTELFDREYTEQPVSVGRCRTRNTI
jgi:hypothetical protein